MATKLFCWGNNHHGQLGIATNDLDVISSPRYLTPPFEDKDEHIQHIACGPHHTLIALQNGHTYACGSNDYSQLGHDKSGNRLVRVTALNNLHVCRLALGTSHSLVLHHGGEIYSWGDNSRGQLGRAAVDDDEWWRIPKLVKELALHTVVQISSGFYHCIALTIDGDVWCWGANNHGQLGVGTNTEFCDRPQHLQCLRGIPVAQVVAGAYHSFVVSKSGALFGWGRNSFGQLGLNDEIDRNTPTFCKFLKNQKLKYISCGENHTAVLTQEGGVYTFGAGGYGQLGHGTTHSEIVPKMVMELMGTPITQVACGRRHTLAYTSESGRIYAFGLGSSGQLGLSTTDNRLSPFPIKGSFALAQQLDADLMETDADATSPSQYVVKRIYSGGDHCLVLTSPLDLSAPPDDFRLCNYEQQPLTLSPELMQQIYSVTEEEQVSQDLLESIEKIWSSSSCLNGSFLKADHAGCNSKNHGLDLKNVREQLSGLAQLNNKTVSSLVWSQLTENLIPSLPKSPPHVEALRLYLILPELPYMDQPHRHNSLITPTGLKLIRLDRAALKVLELWWATLESKYFSRIVYVYKQCLSHVLSLATGSESEQRIRRRTVLVSMEVLKKLNAVNESNGQIIPYHQFYVPEVKEAVDIRKDYILWLQKNRSAAAFDRTENENPLFCDYAFLFDAATKSVLLQTDALLQMQCAIDEVNLRNFTSFFRAIDPINPCLVLFVHRDRIMQDTLDQLNKYGQHELKKPLKVIFVGEEAVDEGGVTKEFFLLIMREILNPDYGMFKYYEESHLQWFNSETFEDTDKFHMIGTICGLAIYNFTIIVLPFPLALFKKLLNRYYTMSSSGFLNHRDKNTFGSANKTTTPAHSNLFKPVILEDLKELMPSVGRSIEQVLEYDGDDFEEVFDLTFDVSVESYGKAKSVELVPDGSKKSVTKENRKEFADAYVDYIFNKSVEEVFQAFSAGFVRVCGGRALELFHPRELQSMVIGNDQYDFLELEKNTTYKDEYHRYHTTIKFFWEVFLDLPLEEKRKFLLFLTGSDRIPITGMGSVKLIIQPTKGGEEFLPVAHTCFNILDLPKYNSKEKLQEKLLLAINQTEGFGLV